MTERIEDLGAIHTRADVGLGAPLAAMDVSVDVLAMAIPVFDGADIHIIGSLRSNSPGTVRVIIQSWGLPDACRAENMLVQAKFTSHGNGAQTISKFESFDVIRLLDPREIGAW